jgi:hypothetical protein
LPLQLVLLVYIIQQPILVERVALSFIAELIT